MMASDKPATEPLAVYLNTNNDPLAHEREAAISKFLAACASPCLMDLASCN